VVRRNRIEAMSRDELAQYVADNIQFLTEDEALSILANPYVSTRLLGTLAQNQRLTGFYSVRLKLVIHRQTPQAHAAKLVHYLFWPDLVRMSVEVTISPPVRRAIDTILVNRVDKLTLGERIAAARRCSLALIKMLLFDPDPKVFEALLNNQRLREDDLLDLLATNEVLRHQILMIADDRKWGSRYAIRKSIVLNGATPRSTAAAQLRFLSKRDLREIHSNPETSVYVRRCIERLKTEAEPAPRRLRGAE
jgi:hypothetical protein